ncbi:hypothetical protein M595_1183 [Lyngbya aestuarii BL J]|uniref:Uncharacterized protein n=1 Tax=Lyngbya aestuarii BL J TaxID=1348334 RepID=U7QNZ1_9CYAN|nr:hypothetical protein [Lyngbya aestuarii]ERT08840.1 hypothetical protein M595_1183 [Lyngbya aestuarii BL J]
MDTTTLIPENQHRIRECRNQDLPKPKSQTKVRKTHLKSLHEQNLMITQEELDALETYTLMIRNKLSILKAVYEI